MLRGAGPLRETWAEVLILRLLYVESFRSRAKSLRSRMSSNASLGSSTVISTVGSFWR